MIIAKFIVIISLGYLIGAIPSGILVGRLTKGIDVREYGSGSTGVANVLRTLGIGAGVAVFAADLTKGACSVLIAGAIVGSGSSMLHAAMVAAALAAIIGHNWPIYIGFQGGRGVTTGFGGLLVMAWPVALACFGVFLVVVALSRYVSLGSILGVTSVIVVMLPLSLLRIEPLAYLAFSIVAGGIIIFRHRENIARLLAGTERKLGERADKRSRQ